MATAKEWRKHLRRCRWQFGRRPAEDLDEAQIEVLEGREERLEAALKEAHHAIKETAKALMVVEGTLRKPYDDDPRWSPWTRFLDRNERSPWTLLVKADTTARSVLQDSGGDQ